MFGLSASHHHLWNQDGLLHAISGLLIITMGLFTVIREWGTRIGYFYILYSASLSGWVLAVAIILNNSNTSDVYIFSRLGNACIAFLPAIFFHMSKVLLDLKWIQRRYISLFWLISTVFSILALTNKQFVHQLKHYEWGYYAQYGIIGSIFIIYFFGLILYTVYQYILVSRRATHGSHIQIRATLLLLSFFVGLIGTIDFLPAYGFDILPMGYIFIFLLFTISIYVTIRYRLVDITAEYAADNIINLINTPLIVTDLEGQIRITNNSAKQLLEGANKAKLINTILPFARNNFSIRKIENSGPIENIEFELYEQNQTIYFSLSISPLLSRRNALLAYIFLLRNITQRKQSEIMLQQSHDELENNVAERTQQLQIEIEQHKATEESLRTAKEIAESASQTKTEFLSRISHELRTPLNAVMGFAQLLDMDNKDFIKSDHRNYIQQILNAGEHLHTLIENILDLSNLDMNKVNFSIEAVDIAIIIKESLQTIHKISESQFITIDNKIGNNSCRVLADQKRFKQIIVSLVANAAKYNRKYGKITINYEIKDGNCFIYITDTGVGISPTNRIRIFEPFEKLDDLRNHTEGAGIGLTLSRRLAYEMNGDINFTSKVGVGSRFWLRLPTA